MGKPRHNYDPACEVLARHFLHQDDLPSPEAQWDMEENIKDLAQELQDTVEAYQPQHGRIAPERA